MTCQVLLRIGGSNGAIQVRTFIFRPRYNLTISFNLLKVTVRI